MNALDNAVWTALTTKQAQQAHSSALARRFPPEMTLLGALAANTTMVFDFLAQLIQRDAVTLYFTAPPKLTPGWDVIRSVELHPLVQETHRPPSSAQNYPTTKIIELTPNHVPEIPVLNASTLPRGT